MLDTTPATTVRLSNGESVVRVTGTLTYAADVDRMDPEAAAALWPDLTLADLRKLNTYFRRSSTDGLIPEWYEDFLAACRYNRQNAA